MILIVFSAIKLLTHKVIVLFLDEFVNPDNFFYNRYISYIPCRRDFYISVGKILKLFIKIGELKK